MNSVHVSLVLQQMRFNKRMEYKSLWSYFIHPVPDDSSTFWLCDKNIIGAQVEFSEGLMEAMNKYRHKVIYAHSNGDVGVVGGKRADQVNCAKWDMELKSRNRDTGRSVGLGCVRWKDGLRSGQTTVHLAEDGTGQTLWFAWYSEWWRWMRVSVWCGGGRDYKPLNFRS